MAVNIVDIKFVNPNPCPWEAPFAVDITFECSQPLPDDIDWKLVYFGSAESEKHDQVLDEVGVGPVNVGLNRFVLEANHPNPELIPDNEAVGVTCILLTGSYQEKEFIRVGYFVNNDYSQAYPELRENNPPKPQFDKIIREVLVSKPRVTRYPIDWGDVRPFNPEEAMPSYLEGVEVNPAFSQQPYYSGGVATPGEGAGGVAEPLSDGVDFTTKLSTALSVTVFQYLDVLQLAICRRVSRAWRSLITESTVYNTFDFSEYEWEDRENSRYNSSLIDFAIAKTSPETTFLNVSYVPLQQDQLQAWLQRCGASLASLDISFCKNLSFSQTLPLITESCSALRELKYFFAPSQTAEGDSSLLSLCEKLGRSLRTIQFSGASDHTLSAISSLLSPDNLRSASFPCASFSDESLLAFVGRFPNLHFLGVELAANITQQTVQQLRTKINVVKASHTPEDFSIEITPPNQPENESESTTPAVVSVRVKGWRELVTDPQILSSIVISLVPSLVQLSATSAFLTCKAAPKEVEQGLLAVGFDDVSIAGEDSEEDDEEAEVDDLEEVQCEVCNSKENEDKLLLCDECEKGFHTYCLKPPLEAIPTGEWYCSGCAGDIVEEDPIEHVQKKAKV